jgi:hypothetical protein
VTTQPTVAGRLLPRNDTEADDHTPGAGGHYVTCTDTALGRDIAFATNGRIDKDGAVYRAAVGGSSGINLDTAAEAARFVGVSLVVPDPGSWDWSETSAWLLAQKGLIVQGWYSRLPAEDRPYQVGAEFGHAMFVSHRSLSSGVRVWDPLNKDTHRWGRWMRASSLRAFLENRDGRHPEFNYRLGYVPLQHL